MSEELQVINPVLQVLNCLVWLKTTAHADMCKKKKVLEELTF